MDVQKTKHKQTVKRWNRRDENLKDMSLVWMTTMTVGKILTAKWKRRVEDQKPHWGTYLLGSHLDVRTAVTVPACGRFQVEGRRTESRLQHSTGKYLLWPLRFASSSTIWLVPVWFLWRPTPATCWRPPWSKWTTLLLVRGSGLSLSSADWPLFLQRNQILANEKTSNQKREREREYVEYVRFSFLSFFKSASCLKCS